MSDRSAAVAFSLSSGDAHDTLEGQKLLATLNGKGVPLLMDRAYEGNKMRELAKKQEFIAVVPPKKNRKHPWAYDKELYKFRNEVERFFLRIKRFRRVFTRYDKLDIIYTGVITMSLIYDAISM